MTPLEPHELDALIARFAPGAALTFARRLHGGVSAEVWALTLTPPHPPLVLRRRADTSGLAREHALAKALHAARFPIPRPYGLWRDDCLVMAFVEGSMTPPPGAARAMADCLARLHGLSLPSPDLPDREDPLPLLRARFGDALADAAARKIDAASPARCLLHGDFWPNNLLWSGQDIAAVLDWEDAALGDPLCDLATARVELAVALGAPASRAFTARYLSLTGLDDAHLPVWDAFVASAALDAMPSWGLPPQKLLHQQRVTQEFLDLAFKNLRSSP